MNNRIMDQEQYLKQVEKSAAKSHIFRDVARSFLVGGLICSAGQGLIALYRFWGLDETVSATLCSVTLILIACILTGLGVYDSFAKFAGAGTLVPITGFANALVAPAIDSKCEGLVLGLSAKLFVVAGPVIVFGVLCSVIYGVVLTILNACAIFPVFQ